MVRGGAVVVVSVVAFSSAFGRENKVKPPELSAPNRWAEVYRNARGLYWTADQFIRGKMPTSAYYVNSAAFGNQLFESAFEFKSPFSLPRDREEAMAFSFNLAAVFLTGNTAGLKDINPAVSARLYSMALSRGEFLGAGTGGSAYRVGNSVIKIIDTSDPMMGPVMESLAKLEAQMGLELEQAGVRVSRLRIVGKTDDGFLVGVKEFFKGAIRIQARGTKPNTVLFSELPEAVRHEVVRLDRICRSLGVDDTAVNFAWTPKTNEVGLLDGMKTGDTDRLLIDEIAKGVDQVN